MHEVETLHGNFSIPFKARRAPEIIVVARYVRKCLPFQNHKCSMKNFLVSDRRPSKYINQRGFLLFCVRNQFNDPK